MKKIVLLFIASATCLALSGCATMFGNKNRTVNVNSTPAGATVTLNGNEVGRTPTKVALGNPTTNSYVIKVSKKGYAPVTRQVETAFQPVGILNILFWPGFIIDAVTGDMVKVTTTNVHASLARR
jgi:uncharacterized protein YceK